MEENKNEIKQEIKEELKEEMKHEKKKGNGLFTLFACVMTGIIVFLATNIGQKASKIVDPDTGSSKPKTQSNVTSNSNDTSNNESNVLSNSNTVSNEASNTASNIASNTTSNTPVKTKLTDAEALTIGKDLYTKATENIINPLTASKCTKVSGDDSKTVYDCTKMYNILKTIFVADHDAFKVFTLKDGKYLYTAGGTGLVGYFSTTLELKSNEANKLVFTANTTVTYDGGSTDVDKFADTFEVVKENGTWKVSKYEYRPTKLK